MTEEITLTIAEQITAKQIALSQNDRAIIAKQRELELKQAQLNALHITRSTLNLDLQDLYAQQRIEELSA